MTRSSILGTGATIATIATIATFGLLAVLGVVYGYRVLDRSLGQAGAPGAGSEEHAAIEPPEEAGERAGAGAHGALYGRVTTTGGGVLEGRLRFGGTEEAYWSDFFNGRKTRNPWRVHVPPEHLTERQSIEAFGIEVFSREREIDLVRPFMTRFGQIARVDALPREILVTLRSGTVVSLDRFADDDVADGVRVWDDARGPVDLVEGQIASIEFLPAPGGFEAPARLHGTVRVRGDAFTGAIQWGRHARGVTDLLSGRAGETELALRFGEIRSIARGADDAARVTLGDGREIALDLGGQGQVVVDDPRFGRVRIPWATLERVDFTDGGGGPAYGDFDPGRPLAGRVTTRAGRALAGRIVFDLDESETTDTLDAPAVGLQYNVPFELVRSIVLPGPGEPGASRATVALVGGGSLELGRAGDLGVANAGVLVFRAGTGLNPDERDGAAGGAAANRADAGVVYVPWGDVDRIDFDDESVDGKPSIPVFPGGD